MNDFIQSKEFAAYANRLLKQHSAPGLAISLIQGDSICSRAFGKASLESDHDFTPDTIFPGGSLIKSLTAASIALLVEAKSIPGFEARMRDVLPGQFTLPGEDHGEATIEDMLCHRTGMPSHEFAMLGESSSTPDDARTLTEKLQHLSLAAPLRDEAIYCNLMYTVASYLVENKSGVSFTEYIETNILHPLQMQSTFIGMRGSGVDNLKARLATLYTLDMTTKERVPFTALDLVESQGASNIFTTVEDYGRWIQALMRCKAPINREVSEQLTRERFHEDADEAITFRMGGAFGWDVQHYEGSTILSHPGGQNGCKATAFFIPDHGFGGVLVANSEQAERLLSQLMYFFLDQKLVNASWDLDGLRTGGDGSQKPLPEVEVESESDDDEAAEAEVIEELCPSGPGFGEQETSLSAYTGQYTNAGYGSLTVQEKDGRLWIDGSERSLPFTLTLKHVCDQTKYVGHLLVEGDDRMSFIKAEFELQDGSATRMGLGLEDYLEDYIWFERT